MKNAIFALDEVHAAEAAAAEQTCCDTTYYTDEDGNEVGRMTGWLC